MLTFEFIQPGEFDDPWYKVTDTDINYVLGGILFIGNLWVWEDSCKCYLDSKAMMQISQKLDNLNGAK